MRNLISASLMTFIFHIKNFCLVFIEILINSMNEYFFSSITTIFKHCFYILYELYCLMNERFLEFHTKSFVLLIVASETDKLPFKIIIFIICLFEMLIMKILIFFTTCYSSLELFSQHLMHLLFNDFYNFSTA